MAVNGKNKGSSFERKIAKEIDIWFQEPIGTFWRTKNSGGIDEPGDIAPRHRPQQKEKVWWPFVIECKHYKSINLLNLFQEKQKNNQLLNWWDQVTDSQQEAKQLGYEPLPLRLLIIRINNYPILCVFNLQEFINRARDQFFYTEFNKTLIYTQKQKDILVITCFENFKNYFKRPLLEYLFKELK